jgi:hypothetical protein
VHPGPFLGLNAQKAGASIRKIILGWTANPGKDAIYQVDQANREEDETNSVWIDPIKSESTTLTVWSISPFLCTKEQSGNPGCAGAPLLHYAPDAHDT